MADHMRFQNPQFLRRHRDPSIHPAISLLSTPADLSLDHPEPNPNDSHADFIVTDEPAASLFKEVPLDTRPPEDSQEGPPPAKKRRMVAFVE